MTMTESNNVGVNEGFLNAASSGDDEDVELEDLEIDRNTMYSDSDDDDDEEGAGSKYTQTILKREADPTDPTGVRGRTKDEQFHAPMVTMPPPIGKRRKPSNDQLDMLKLLKKSRSKPSHSNGSVCNLEQRVKELEEKLAITLQAIETQHIQQKEQAELHAQRMKIVARDSLILTLRANGTVAEPQPAWSDFTGQTWDECNGFGWVNAIDSGDRSRFQARLNKLNEGTAVEEKLSLFSVSENGYKKVKLSLTPITIGNAIREWIGIVKDETDESTIQELREHAKKLEDYVNTVCHEIRNPLNGLKGSIEWLKDVETSLEEFVSAPPDATLKKETLALLRTAIETNQECIHHQVSIVDDVLDLAKLNSGMISLAQVPFDAHSEVRSVCTMFRGRLEEKQLILKLQLPDRNKILIGDPASIRVIIINLITNAVKFTPPKGTISISMNYHPISEEEMVLQFEVTDTGIGMTEDEKNEVFEKFIQVGTEASRNGSGLGLAISKNLAECMGGQIVVESEPNKGTKFIVTVKCGIASEEQEREYQTSEGEKPTEVKFNNAKCKILIVEDNATNQKVMEWILKKRGHEGEIAGNGEQALERFLSKKYDLLFMDLYLPNMSGITLVKRIRQIEKDLGAPRTPVIGLSGNMREYKAALEAGMDGFITKPFSKEDIWQTINRWKSSNNPSDDYKNSSLNNRS